PVQVHQVDGLGHGHPVVTPEIACLRLDPTVLVTFPRRAKLRGEPPVRTESNEARRLFPLLSPQDLLHRRTEIVEPEPVKNPAKPRKSQLVRFQKRLLRGVRESAVEG